MFHHIKVLVYKNNAHVFLCEMFREPLYGKVFGHLGLNGFIYHRQSPTSFILLPAIAQSAILYWSSLGDILYMFCGLYWFLIVSATQSNWPVWNTIFLMLPPCEIRAYSPSATIYSIHYNCCNSLHSNLAFAFRFALDKSCY